MILDKKHNEVKIGSWVKVLFIEPGFISRFLSKNAKIMKAMINKAFEVVSIKHGKALVYQAFDVNNGFSFVLAPEEMELAYRN